MPSARRTQYCPLSTARRTTKCGCSQSIRATVSTMRDRAGILRFQARGGGLMVTRDHMDLGCSVCAMGPVGAAHVFQYCTTLPVPSRRPTIAIRPRFGWPDFHSGANGDVQPVRVELPVHPIMRDEESETGAIAYLPAHPHEGAVVAPASDPAARVIATGKSLFDRPAIQPGSGFRALGYGGARARGIDVPSLRGLQLGSSPRRPDFVTEKPVYTLPDATLGQRWPRPSLCHNVALWLAGTI